MAQNNNVYLCRKTNVDGPSIESLVYLQLGDGSQTLCKLIDVSELENPMKHKLVDDSRPEIVEAVENKNEKEIIDDDVKEKLVFVNAFSNDRNELVCFTENGKRSYVCQIEGCGRHFGSRIYLKTHQRNHTGERPFKCVVCSTAFNTDYALQVHWRRHTGEKPYEYLSCIPLLL